MASKFGVKSLEDWGNVTCRNINANGGNTLTQLYGGSMFALLKDSFPGNLKMQRIFISRNVLGFRVV